MFIRLTQIADQWRVLARTGGHSVQLLRRRIPCLLVPISASDPTPPYAVESTVVVFLPHWLRDIAAEDELRLGRRTDRDGRVLQNRYHVDGVRRYRNGLRHTEAFVTEKE
jgi:hypothetical protein